MPHFMPLLSLCLASIILVTILVILTSTSTSNKFLHFILQINHSAFAKPIASKYPEVALPFPKGPTILNPELKTQVVFRGLEYPTSMAFLGPNDILVTEKDEGIVRRIVDGTELQQPLLNVDVATYGHRGMLGIAIAPHSSITTVPRDPNSQHNKTTSIANVFLYYTQGQIHTSDDIAEEEQPLGNRLYRYELVGNKLVNPKLLLDLPATPGAIGDGGKVIIGPDNNVYVTIGDVGINGHNG